MYYKNRTKSIVLSSIIFFGLFLFTTLCNAQYVNYSPYSGYYGAYGGYPSTYGTYGSYGYPSSYGYGTYGSYGGYPSSYGYGSYGSYGGYPSTYGTYGSYGYPSSYGTFGSYGYPSSYGYGTYGGFSGFGFGSINPYILSLYTSAMANPFGIQNIYYTIDTGTDVNYQIPFIQIAPLLGITSLYNNLFPDLFTFE